MPQSPNRKTSEGEGRISPIWKSILYNAAIGAVWGALLSIWFVYEEDALAHFARSGPGIVLYRPLLSVALFGGILGCTLFCCAEAVLGVTGMVLWLSAGLGLICSTVVVVGVICLIERSAFGAISVMVLLVFNGGAVVTAVLRNRLRS